jgi:hypothetical protein
LDFNTVNIETISIVTKQNDQQIQRDTIKYPWDYKKDIRHNSKFKENHLKKHTVHNFVNVYF